MKNTLKMIGLAILMAALMSNVFQALAEEVPAEAPVIETVEVPVVEAVEAPVVEAVEAPEVEAAEVPAIETVEAPVVEAAEVPEVEATEAPEVEAFEVPVVEAAPFVFTGEVDVCLENNGEIFFGDIVTLRAVVCNANADYTISWEVDKTGSGSSWEALSGETDTTYSFEVTEENAAYAYRAVLAVAE